MRCGAIRSESVLNETPRRHGYPLWIPEPNKGHEIQIGDVGYMYEGGFYLLFNTTLPADDEVNAEKPIPEDYKPFIINHALVNETKRAIFSHLCSTSVAAFGIEGGLQA